MNRATADQGVEKNHSTKPRLASQWSMHAWLILPLGTLPKHGGTEVPMKRPAIAAITP